MSRMSVILCTTVLTVALVLAGGTAWAAPMKTNLYGLDGFFMATGGNTIPAGELVVGGFGLIVSDDNVDLTSVPVTVTYGFNANLEVAAAFEVYKNVDFGGGNDDAGTGDMYLSAKYAIQEENTDYPATALGIRLKIPMADQPLSSEETDISLFAAMEMSMKSVKGVLNVEYLMPGGDAENQVLYIVGLEIPYSDTTDFTLELMDQPQNFIGDLFAAGATFDMGTSLNFGVAVGFGLNDPSADVATMGKITFTF